ncbi:MAG: Veg family protein [Coriobacteriaceae bacterium]|nr:Veg family protein [Coriobacteriaceae bacterium]
MDDAFDQKLKVEDIHQALTDRTGCHLRIRANLGRSKVVDREGILTQTHRSLFLVEVNEKRGRTARHSYQYVDVLTGMVELTDYDTGEPLFPMLTEEPDAEESLASDAADSDADDDASAGREATEG